MRSQDDVVRVSGNRGAFHRRVLLVEGDQRVHFFHVTCVDWIGDDTLDARVELQGVKPRAQRRLVAGEQLNERRRGRDGGLLERQRENGRLLNVEETIAAEHLFQPLDLLVSVVDDRPVVDVADFELLDRDEIGQEARRTEGSRLKLIVLVEPKASVNGTHLLTEDVFGDHQAGFADHHVQVTEDLQVKPDENETRALESDESKCLSTDCRCYSSESEDRRRQGEWEWHHRRFVGRIYSNETMEIGRVSSERRLPSTAEQ